MPPLAVSGMMLLVPLCLPSLPAAPPLPPCSLPASPSQHLHGAGPAEEGLQAPSLPMTGR